MKTVNTSPARLFTLRIAALRTAVGSSWASIYTGTDSGTLSRWITGKTAPSEASMLKAEKCLRQSLIETSKQLQALQDACPNF
jgi:hypothetical protein